MNYWIIEMIKVFLAYMFVLFVWPSVVFYKYFRNKSLSQRFLICTIGVPIAITTLVIMLGLFHLLYQLIFVIGFYVIFAVQLYRMLDIPQEFFLHIKYLMTGSMKFKTFVFQINDWIRERSGNWIRKWWGLIRPHFLECVILFIISCYALIYFGIGCFEVTSYGASDMYVHHSWIYGLKQGKIFVNGIYPEGMHCLIYLMNTVFGIKIYDILLLLQPIHTSFVLFVSIYLFIKELTYSSFSGIYALILFAVMKVDRINMVFGMSRLQWTIPQDFGMYLAFSGTLLLIKYLRSNAFARNRNHLKNLLINKELIWFSLALADTIIIHFYITGMMFFLCLIVVIVNLRKVFSIRRFASLAFAIVIGFLLAMLPMVGAFLEGIPLQGSIGWAIGVMNGTMANPVQSSNTLINTLNQTPRIYESGIIGSIQKERLPDFALVYENATYGFTELYDHKLGPFIRRACLIIAAISLSVHVILLIVRSISHTERIKEDALDGYFILSGSALIIMVCYCAQSLGLIQLFAPTRLSSLEHILCMAVMTIPVDFLAFIYIRIFKRQPFKVFGILLSGLLIYSIIASGNYHSYLYFDRTSYNAAVEVTNRIISDYPKNSFTVVSVVDELYQVNEHGFHEEVLRFVNYVEDKEHYTLPSEYVFIYVEKHPMIYGQKTFFAGPEWLAKTDYYSYYDPEDKYDIYTQYPTVNHMNVSKEIAKEKTPGENYGQHAYLGVYNRTILESKLYYWCQKFMKMFPYETEIYYEDQDFVCYKIKQNTYRLFELSIDYMDQ